MLSGKEKNKKQYIYLGNMCFVDLRARVPNMIWVLPVRQIHLNLCSEPTHMEKETIL